MLFITFTKQKRKIRVSGWSSEKSTKKIRGLLQLRNYTITNLMSWKCKGWYWKGQHQREVRKAQAFTLWKSSGSDIASDWWQPNSDWSTSIPPIRLKTSLHVMPNENIWSHFFSSNPRLQRKHFSNIIFNHDPNLIYFANIRKPNLILRTKYKILQQFSCS